MAGTEQTRRVTTASRDTLLTMLETLPDAFFLVDNVDTILYANHCAQALLDATPEALVGTTFWRGAPHLVSTTLYQAVRTTRETQEPTEVEYVSPVTRTWLHVQLAPTVGGLALHFHEQSAPLPRRETFVPDHRLAADVLENMYVGVGVLTPEGILLEINEAPLEDAQIRREEVIGYPFAETPWWTFYPASQEQLRAAITRASRGETVRFETLIHPREGMDLHLEATITPHRDVDHHVAYLVYVGTDITERKRAEGAIHALVDALPQLVWIARPDGDLIYNNQRLIDYLAMTHEQAEGKGWLTGVHPDERTRVWKAWLTSIQTGEPYEVEHRMRDGTSGAYRWFLVRGVPQRNAQGTVLHWVGTCTDIEDQKQAEQQIKESRENWHVLAETVPQLVWTTRADNCLDYCNQRYCEYTHAAFEQLQGHGWRQFLHPEDAERVMPLRHQTLETGEPFEDECRLRNGQTGTYRWFLARGMPVRDETGQITKWFGTNTDIEDQKRIEEALRQSQERIRALIDSNIIGITSSEVDGEVIVEANDAWLHMTGYTPEDVRSRTLTRARITLPEDAPLFERAIQEVTTRGQHTPFETELVCKDGSRLPVLVGGVIFQEHPRQMVSFTLDNSARKELEQRKDAFISMASHELRNPLTALKLQTTLLQRQLAKQGIQTSAPALSSMEIQTNKLTRLVEELLDVSKIQAGRLEYIWETVDLDALLREITETMQQTSPSHTIVVRGTVGISLIGDRDRLGQVFTNLISNAIKYSPGAQTVEIDLDTSEDAITIHVRDHGLGIPREQRDKIFERFYRVVDPRRKAISGLGMGLYIVAEIIKHHRGTITVDSAVGKGSNFTVTLPRTRDA